MAIATPNASPSPAAPPAKAGGASSRLLGIKTSNTTPKTLLSRARRRSSPSPTREGRSSPTPKSGQRLYGAAHFAVACEELPAYAEALFAGTIIVGNGRSVLGQRAGPAVDRFARVIRFNDFQIGGFEADVGRKVDLWCVSDWTAVKLFNKYPDRTLPTLIAIPYKFMGKPYYEERRAELEQQLTPEQLARATFVPAEVVKALIDENTFGERWPSSGLITIMYMLGLGEKAATPETPFSGQVFLHGFDFFKEIDGKIHYMEDTHKANHHAAEEERICMELVRQLRVAFL